MTKHVDEESKHSNNEVWNIEDDQSNNEKCDDCQQFVDVVTHLFTPKHRMSVKDGHPWPQNMLILKLDQLLRVLTKAIKGISSFKQNSIIDASNLENQMLWMVYESRVKNLQNSFYEKEEKKNNKTEKKPSILSKISV